MKETHFWKKCWVFIFLHIFVKDYQNYMLWRIWFFNYKYSSLTWQEFMYPQKLKLDLFSNILLSIWSLFILQEIIAKIVQLGPSQGWARQEKTLGRGPLAEETSWECGNVQLAALNCSLICFLKLKYYPHQWVLDQV